MSQPVEELPALLTERQVSGLLSVEAGRMEKLRQHLHYVKMPGEFTRRYSLQYATALSGYIGRFSVDQQLIDAGKFATTDPARLAIEEAEKLLRKSLSDRFVRLNSVNQSLPSAFGILDSDLELRLNLTETPTTLAHWIGSHILSVYCENDEQFIDEFSVRSNFWWMRPQGYPGDPQADIVLLEQQQQ